MTFLDKFDIRDIPWHRKHMEKYFLCGPVKYMKILKWPARKFRVVITHLDRKYPVKMILYLWKYLSL